LDKTLEQVIILSHVDSSSSPLAFYSLKLFYRILQSTGRLSKDAFPFMSSNHSPSGNPKVVFSSGYPKSFFPSSYPNSLFPSDHTKGVFSSDPPNSLFLSGLPKGHLLASRL